MAHSKIMSGIFSETEKQHFKYVHGKTIKSFQVLQMFVLRHTEKEFAGKLLVIDNSRSILKDVSNLLHLYVGDLIGNWKIEH